MKRIKKYIIIFVFIFFQSNIYSQSNFTKFTIIFEDNSKNSNGENFFNEINGFLNSHQPELSPKLTMESIVIQNKWNQYKKSPNVYLSRSHEYSKFFFKFSLNETPSKINGRKQLKVVVGDRDNKYFDNKEIVIFDDDIFVWQVKYAMPIIGKQIEHSLTGEKKEVLYVSKIDELYDKCDSYTNGYDFFFQAAFLDSIPELFKKYYILKWPCNLVQDQKGNGQRMIACYKKNQKKPDEIEFQFSEEGKPSKIVKETPKCDCASAEEDIKKNIIKYCKQIIAKLL